MNYYIRLKLHDYAPDTMEVHVPWAKGGCLLMNSGPQLLHSEENDIWDFTDQYVAPFKVKHAFKKDGICACGAVIDPACLGVSMNFSRELILSGATHYCDQFLFEKSLRILKRVEYGGVQIRIHTNTFDLSVVEAINTYTRVMIVMEE